MADLVKIFNVVGLGGGSVESNYFDILGFE